MNLNIAFLTVRRTAIALCFCLGLNLFGSVSAEATIVRYQTVLGDIDVRLYDTATPASVANFMNYLNDGDWDDSIIHRSVSDFVVQGGGFKWDSELENITRLSTDPSVINEPGISNLRGTVAYAKLGSDPNSATSQWFFNVDDNTFLDNPLNNGGFTVFGRVLGNGMDIVDAINALPTTDFTYFDTTFSQNVTLQDLPIWDFPTAGTFTTLTTVTELAFNDADYNFDGVVDAADYTVWRDTLGSTTQAEADGNGNGIVDQADYDLWVSNFAITTFSNSASAAVPEPASLFLLLSCFGLTCHHRRAS